jgi:hypothetical protein
MLRAGVSFPVLMKLLGHTDPEMTMRYVDVALTDVQREFHQARTHPKYLVPQPKASSIPLRAGRDGVIDSLLAAQHVLEMFRRPPQRALLALASTASPTVSPTVSPRSSQKPANCAQPEIGQRLAG